MMKTCSKCGIHKEIENFCNDKSRKDGYFPQCRQCKNADKKNYYEQNKESILEKSLEYQRNNKGIKDTINKRYRENNKEKISERNKELRKENPEKFKEYQKLSYKKNRIEILKRQKEYFLKNSEKRNEAYKKYSEANRDKINTRSLDNYHKNPGKHNELVKRWHLKNKDKRLSYTHKYRTKKANGTGCYTSEEWNNLKRFYEFTCLCCGKSEPEIKLTIDHVIPLSQGGSNYITNIQPLCLHCNQVKRSKIKDFREGIV